MLRLVPFRHPWALGVLLVAASAARAADPTAALTSSGRVAGLVIDSETHRALPGARVTLLPSADSPRNSSGQTNDFGEYDLRAPLGQIRRHIYWSRLLFGSLATLINPRGVTSEDRFIRATSFRVRAEKPGYKPFEGPIDMADSRPEKFAVFLWTVRLAPEVSAARSTVLVDAPREALESFTIEPPVARPGETVTFKARLSLPNDPGIKYSVTVGGYRRLFRHQDFALHQQPGHKGDGLHVIFLQRVAVPRDPADFQDRFQLTLRRDERPVELDALPEPLFQAVKDPADMDAARKLAEADARALQGDTPAAYDLARQAAELRPGYLPASMFASRLAAKLRRWPDAAIAAKHVVDAAVPGTEEAADTYAEASLAAGTETGAALKTLLAPMEAKLPKQPKALKQRAEGYWNRAMGRACLADHDIDGAADHFQRAALRIAVPSRMLTEVRLARTEKSFAQQSDAVHARDLARALRDAGRKDEAIALYRRIETSTPDDAWMTLELAQTLAESGKDEAALGMLSKIGGDLHGNPEVARARGESLFRLHRYAEAVEPLQSAASAERLNADLLLDVGAALWATGKTQPALQAFGAAAKLLESKPEVTDEMTPTPWGILYMKPRLRSAAGYQTERAEQAAHLIRDEARLQHDPADADARLDEARALVSLGVPDAALARLSPTAADSSPSALRVRAAAEESLKRWPEARDDWERVVRDGPDDREAVRHAALCRAMTEGPDAARVVLIDENEAENPDRALRRMTLWD